METTEVRTKKVDLYAYTNYKDVVRDALKDETGRVPRGGYKDLANYLRCNPSFLSHFFKKDIHFTMDHAFMFSKYIGLNREETRYFMSLIYAQKAGNFKTREFFKDLLDESKQQNKFSSSVPLSTSDEVPLNRIL